MSRSTLVSWAPYVASGLAIAGSYAYFSSMAIRTPLRADSHPKALTGDGQWVDFKLARIAELSHNVKKFTVALPSSDHVLGDETASCILLKYMNENNKPVIRPYTPTTPVDKLGEFELVIKKYENSKMGTHLFNLKAGDSISVKGPILKYAVTPNLHKEIALIGGGTGITPLFQVLQSISRNPSDKTKVKLIYGNISESDILLKKEIDAIVAAKPEQFSVHYFLDKPSAGWKGQSGFITADFLAKNIPSAKADNVKVMVCGPPPLYQAISGNKVSPSDQGEVEGALKELGFSKDQVFKF
ncbi:NADH-cytochrome b5 reductase 2 [Nadsonia fulvescens var. elongata DSM 6958]|uniref:NADH-cytochrome b5 reductase n=1 Tax=Nadsonia fulvescens var. elongata DSM 6958 TaxID=857566 RepID=A0A1E3PNU2_9ASCO|nr:NADH-cytochrome b5 reductase 2 [Nadsonia fulvescens var. elongata DSM 6958]